MKLLIWLLVFPVMGFGADKVLLPEVPDARICPRGQALTWTLQCDPGTRYAVDRIWAPPGPGVEICAVAPVGCTPIPDFNPLAAPGFEVLQSNTRVGGVVVVTFGLDQLLPPDP